MHVRPADIGRRVRGQRVGPYELLTPLEGRGERGLLWAARRRTPGEMVRVVAIRFASEPDGEPEPPETTPRVCPPHPHVVAMLESVSHARWTRAIALEYVEAVSLRELASSGAPVPPRVALAVVRDALLGLAAVHERAALEGLPEAHLDLAPSTILVRTAGVGVVTDLAVARTLRRWAGEHLGIARSRIGYLAPEQLHGRGVSPRTDVYAMGIVLWELLSGRRLFGDAMSSLVLAPERSAPRIGEIHQDLGVLDRVVGRALERDPRARFGSALELARAIEVAARALGGIARPAETSRFVRQVAGDELALRRARLGAAIAAVPEHDATLAPRLVFERAAHGERRPSGVVAGTTRRTTDARLHPSGTRERSSSSVGDEEPTVPGGRSRTPRSPPLGSVESWPELTASAEATRPLRTGASSTNRSTSRDASREAGASARVARRPLLRPTLARALAWVGSLLSLVRCVSSAERGRRR